MEFAIKKVMSSSFVRVATLIVAVLSLCWAVYVSIDAGGIRKAQENAEAIKDVPALHFSWLSNLRYELSRNDTDAKSVKNVLRSEFKIENISDSILSDMAIEVFYSFDENLVTYPYSDRAMYIYLTRRHESVFRPNSSIAFDLFDAFSRRGFDIYSIMPVPESYLIAEKNKGDSVKIKQQGRHYFSDIAIQENASPGVDKTQYDIRAVFLKLIVSFSHKSKLCAHLITGALGFGRSRTPGNSGIYLDGFSATPYIEVRSKRKSAYYLYNQYVYNGNDYFSAIEEEKHFAIVSFGATDSHGFRSYPWSIRINVVRKKQ